MKQFVNNKSIRALFTTMFLLIGTYVATAQENKIKIEGETIGAWLQQNWMWVVAGFVVLLLLIGILSNGKTRRSKTTIVREEDANGIIRTTTTEIKE